jgi:hypothetical protein
MKSFDTKKFISGLVFLCLFIGGVFTYCHMNDMDMMTPMHANAMQSDMHGTSIECLDMASHCPGMENDVLKDLLGQIPLPQKALLLLSIASVFVLVGKFSMRALLEPIAARLQVADMPPPSYLLLAFARGILNSKLYNV